MILFLAFVILFVCFGLVVFRGAPYVPTHKKSAVVTLKTLPLKKGDLVVDLGSGDGVFLKSAAKLGYRAVGYELNPILCAISYFRCWKFRKQVKVIWGDFWLNDLPKDTKAVYVFLASSFMQKFKTKMQAEAVKLKRPIYVASNGFELAGIKPINIVRGVNVYKVRG
jgi:hypothetical protein